MNNIARTLAIVTATLLFSAVPILADEGNMGSTDSGVPQIQQRPKDECLLVAKNCGRDVDSIQERINRLDREIGRGADAYTPEELQKLQNERDDYQRQFDLMLESGG